MPEQISKYPEVTIQVLKGAGARCGAGVGKKILTKCPSDRFCSFASGEVCVYGLDQIPQLTQITPQDLANALHVRYPREGGLSGVEAGVLAATFAVGLLAGMLLSRWSRTRGPS